MYQFGLSEYFGTAQVRILNEIAQLVFKENCTNAQQLESLPHRSYTTLTYFERESYVRFLIYTAWQHEIPRDALFTAVYYYDRHVRRHTHDADHGICTAYMALWIGIKVHLHASAMTRFHEICTLRNRACKCSIESIRLAGCDSLIKLNYSCNANATSHTFLQKMHAYVNACVEHSHAGEEFKEFYKTAMRLEILEKYLEQTLCDADYVCCYASLQAYALFEMYYELMLMEHAQPEEQEEGEPAVSFALNALKTVLNPKQDDLLYLKHMARTAIENYRTSRRFTCGLEIKMRRTAKSSRPKRQVTRVVGKSSLFVIQEENEEEFEAATEIEMSTSTSMELSTSADQTRSKQLSEAVKQLKIEHAQLITAFKSLYLSESCTKRNSIASVFRRSLQRIRVIR